MIRTKTTHYEKMDNDDYHVQISNCYIYHERIAIPMRKQIVRNNKQTEYHHMFHVIKRATMELGGY